MTGSLPIIVQNDNNVNFSFALEYKNETFEAGQNKEYYYYVNEIKGNLDYITYDDAEYFVKVTLQDNGDGSTIAVWSTLAFASIMVCGALLVIEKKRKNEI